MSAKLIDVVDKPVAKASSSLCSECGLRSARGEHIAGCSKAKGDEPGTRLGKLRDVLAKRKDAGGHGSNARGAGLSGAPVTCNVAHGGMTCNFRPGHPGPHWDVDKKRNWTASDRKLVAHKDPGLVDRPFARTPANSRMHKLIDVVMQTDVDRILKAKDRLGHGSQKRGWAHVGLVHYFESTKPDHGNHTLKSQCGAAVTSPSTTRLHASKEAALEFSGKSAPVCRSCKGGSKLAKLGDVIDKAAGRCEMPTNMKADGKGSVAFKPCPNPATHLVGDRKGSWARSCKSCADSASKQNFEIKPLQKDLQAAMVQHEAKSMESRLKSSCPTCKAPAGELCRHDFHTAKNPAHRLVPHAERAVAPLQKDGVTHFAHLPGAVHVYASPGKTRCGKSTYGATITERGATTCADCKKLEKAEDPWRDRIEGEVLLKALANPQKRGRPPARTGGAKPGQVVHRTATGYEAVATDRDHPIPGGRHYEVHPAGRRQKVGEIYDTPVGKAGETGFTLRPTAVSHDGVNLGEHEGLDQAVHAVATHWEQAEGAKRAVKDGKDKKTSVEGRARTAIGTDRTKPKRTMKLADAIAKGTT